MAAFNPNAWSYSALKKYENCPRQYSEIVVFRNYKDVFSSPKGDVGDRFHKEAERCIRDGADLSPEFKGVQHALDVVRSISGVKYPEFKMGVTADGEPVEWNAPNRWFQGISDLVVVGDSPVARILDYKTGSAKYADTDQIELMSMLLFAKFPHIKLVKGALLFVLENKLISRNIDIKDKDRLWQKYREKDAKRLASFHNNNWPAKTNGLCKKHCIVTSCEHNGRR